MRGGLAGALVAVALASAPGPARAAWVASGDLRVRFSPPGGWVEVRAPAPLLALYRPKGGGTFPHLAVSEGEAGSAADAAARLSRGLSAFFLEQGITDARVLIAPREGRSPDRVELAYSGRLGEAACDWFQVVLPGARSGLVFTVALPRGTLAHRRDDIDAFVRSLRSGP